MIDCQALNTTIGILTNKRSNIHAFSHFALLLHREVKKRMATCVASLMLNSLAIYIRVRLSFGSRGVNWVLRMGALLYNTRL